jgi:Co/Zn/Cd efflux system component
MGLEALLALAVNVGVAIATTGTAWPDLLVAGVMATLALSASVAVIRQASVELKLVAPVR